MTVFSKCICVCLISLVLLPTIHETALAQNTEVSPTHRDVPYDDDHKSQRVDVYLPESNQLTPTMIYIHGGGWRAGSKNNVPAWLKKLVSDGQIAVVSVEYRFTDVATHPAQVHDCRRAIQFVRHHAKKWNIDPARIGVTGGSAGGHLSAWVALHDDAAQPDSKDPVERQSSRVTCAVSFAGPTDWSLLSTINHRHPAYRQLIGYQPGTPATDLAENLIKDVSPISFVTPDDPPVMQVHGDKDDIVPLEHASNLHRKLKAAEVTSELVVIPGGNHSVAGARGQTATRATAFVQKYLLGP